VAHAYYAGERGGEGGGWAEGREEPAQEEKGRGFSLFFFFFK
jgi:hypothetical protein